MIEQIVRVLAKILFNVEMGNYRGAFDEIDSAFKGLTGLDYNLLNSLSDKDIIALLKISEDNEITGAKCFVIGKLLKEAAGLKAMEENNYSINSEYQKALSLYLEGILSNRNSIQLFADYFKDIDIIVEKIKDDEISPDIRFKLFKFYELTGKYDKAEEELFNLKRLNYFDIQKEGINFYGKLEMKSDDDLKKGNFSREEVKQRLNELGRKPD
jgi:tetratricopeptide (TPR) repeat protein